MIKLILHTYIKRADIYGNIYGFSKLVNTGNGKSVALETTDYANHAGEIYQALGNTRCYEISKVLSAKDYKRIKDWNSDNMATNTVEALKKIGFRVKKKGLD
tara:strand:- start:703 stop:1008 length:306 start_codon:yes stop_codon:yes gene_type:complete